MRLLIATGIVAGLLAGPAIADDKLNQAADMAAFAIACPSHWNRLPPRTQRIIVGIGEDAGRSYDKETIEKAVREAYANGYDKQGERWCVSMQKMLTDAGNF